VERWDVSAAVPPVFEERWSQPARSFVAPVAVRGQPMPLRRARDVIFEHALAPGPKVLAESRFHPGDRVEHARFGRGVIKASEMTGAGEEVVIGFDSAGVRRFAVSDAVLRLVER
jgi:hypothetical protein